MSMPQYQTSSNLQKFRKEFCHAYGRKDQYNISHDLKQVRPLKTIIVDDQHKTLFCYVPKIACGNWKRIFLVLTGTFAEISDIGIDTAHEDVLLKNLADLTSNDIRKRIKTYKKFIVVREPMERLLSAYRNKIYDDVTGKFKRLFGEKIMKYSQTRRQPGRASEKVSFVEFVEFMTEAPMAEIFELHWERIYKICHPCLIDYDYVGKYENLAKDSLQIVNMISPNTDIARFPAYQMAYGNTKKMMSSYFSQITQTQLATLLSLYKLDYLLFGYAIPDYLFDVVKKDTK